MPTMVVVGKDGAVAPGVAIGRGAGPVPTFTLSNKRSMLIVDADVSWNVRVALVPSATKLKLFGVYQNPVPWPETVTVWDNKAVLPCTLTCMLICAVDW